MARDKKLLKTLRVVSDGLAEDDTPYATVRLGEDFALVERLTAALSEVKGQDYARHVVEEYLFGIAHRQNAKGVGGLLLFAGPPAVGKTMMAEKIAEALGRPYLRVDLSSFNDKESFCDAFGLNPSYKSAEAGFLTSFVLEHPVCVVLLDEMEKCHPNVRARFLQVFERGEVQDLFLKKSVSFRDVIVIVTTNVGRAIYDKDFVTYNLSKTPQSVIIKELRSEIDPQFNVPYFTDALVSRFTQGKIVFFNKLRPETLHLIAKEEMDRHMAYYAEHYHLTFELDKDALAALILFNLGEQADVRTVMKAVRDFFEHNLLRLVKAKHAKSESYFGRIVCEFDFAHASPAAAHIFFNTNKSRLLVHAGEKTRPIFERLQSEKTEILFAEEETRSFAALDISAAVTDVTAAAARDFFDEAIALDAVPVYAYAGEPVDSVVFDEYTDNGATECYGGEDLAGWAESVVKGLGLSSIAQSLYRANKIITYSFVYSFPEEGVAKLTVTNLDAALAVEAGDVGTFVSDHSVPEETFEDIIGAEDAKREFKGVLETLRNYKKYARMGLRIPRGVLLDGEPGTGKTMLAKALAHEAELPFIQRNATEFEKRYLGEGPKAVRELFATARKYAPCILFIDEIDAVARARGGDEQNLTSDLTNTFLSELDGFEDKSSAPVFVVAATNFSAKKGETLLDAGFLRRFDRKIHVDLPDRADRALFLRRALSKLENCDAEGVVDTIAARSVGWSLADLNLVVQNAARQAVTDGTTLTEPILLEAFECFVDGEAKARDEEYLKKTALHEAGHAVVSMKLGYPPTFATVTSRGNYGGYVFTNNEEKSEYTRRELKDRIAICMAGRAAEISKYGEEGIGTGASSDLRNATGIATDMVCRYGMADLPMCLAQNVDDKEVRARIADLVKEGAERAAQLIEEHRDALERVAAALIEKNSLGERELSELAGEGGENGSRK